jgi:uncharacterized membrane protein YphA (DoxX/SURF4 family)
MSSNKLAVGFALALRIVIGGIFVYAAWLKLQAPWPIFAMNIDSYQVLPMPAVEFVARTLPWLELLLGIWLIAGVWRKISTLAASLLLIVFFGLMIRAMAKGLQIDCGCFGPGDRLSPLTLVRDGSLLAGSLFATFMAFRSRRSAAAPVAAGSNALFAGSTGMER